MALIPILLYLAAWIAAWIDAAHTANPFSYELIRYVLLLSVGIQGIWAFLAHFFNSKDTAEQIGWKPGPFQKEIAFANLSYGVMGVFSFWFQSVWFGTILGITIFLLGAAFTHFKDMLENNNFKPGNAGPIFYLDIIIPLTLWIAVWVHFSH